MVGFAPRRQFELRVVRLLRQRLCRLQLPKLCTPGALGARRTVILAFSSVDSERASVMEHRAQRKPPYTSLPLWSDSQRLLVSVEQAVRGFSRHHKFTASGDLRRLAMVVCRLVARAAQTGEARSRLRLPGCTVRDDEALDRVCDNLASQGGAGALRSTKARSSPNTVRLSPCALSEATGLSLSIPFAPLRANGLGRSANSLGSRPRLQVAAEPPGLQGATLNRRPIKDEH